jgi:hypothetical protein
MIQQLPEIKVPKWLLDLTPSEIMNEPFPLNHILKDSLYYPSSGFDGDPIRHLAGNFLSFIYVDYGYTSDELINALQAPGFLGYELIGTRVVTEQELAPKGWDPISLTSSDGNPMQFNDEMKQPFCSWMIFQRNETVSQSHGPFRFSLLYLCADGVAAFQALYVATKKTPKAIAIIQPGHGFGANWTDFTNPEQIFARSVLGNKNGPPEILLYGGYGKRNAYRNPCWPNYQNHVCFVDKVGLSNGNIGIWTKVRQT